MAVLIIVVIESFAFSHAYLSADMSNLCIIHKSGIIKDRENFDVVVFGASRALSIDGKALEQSEDGEGYSVYNLALPHLGTSLEFYLALKKYLEHKVRPKLILLSIPPEMFGVTDKDGIFEGDPRKEAGRFRRFFDLSDLIFNVPFRGKWSIVKEYTRNMIPSFNYGQFITRPYSFLSLETWRTKWTKEIMIRNRNILRHLDETNGQLVYHADRIVPEGELFQVMPTRETGRITAGNVESAENIERFVALANRHDIPVLFFFMPLVHERYEKMEEIGYIDSIMKRIRCFEDRYGRFHYVDIGPLSYTKDFFGDWSHLNRRGVARFNRELQMRFKEMLRQAGLSKYANHLSLKGAL